MITRRRTCASPPYLSIFCRSVKIQMKFKAMLKNRFLIDLWKSKLCERCEPGEIGHDRRPEIQPRLLENTWSSLSDRCWFAPMGVTLWKPYNIISFCPLFEIWDSLKYLRSASRSAECDLTGRTHAEGISPSRLIVESGFIVRSIVCKQKTSRVKRRGTPDTSPLLWTWPLPSIWKSPAYKPEHKQRTDRSQAKRSSFHSKTSLKHCNTDE